MDLQIDRVRQRHFRAQASLEDGGIVVELGGTADIPAREALQNLLGQVRAEANRHGVKKVTVDLQDLEFMNSSCFKDFVSWLSVAQGEADQYNIHFLSSPEMHWQKRSLHALRSFAPEIVSIEVISG